MPDIAETLARWGLTLEEAERAGMYGVDDASDVDSSYPAEPALVIPYFTIGGEPLMIGERQFTRIRRLTSPAVIEGFKQEKVAKYLQPPGTGSQIYFPRVGGDWRMVASNTEIPVIITEGEAKALVSSLRVAPTIALGGVYSFMDAQGKLNPDLAAFNWDKRDTAVIYDSDAAYNTNVAAAESRLANELFYRLRAKLKIIRLPGGDDRKVGLDDYLRLFGAASLRALINQTSTLLSKDGRILALNSQIVWVEAERLVYDVNSRIWIPKDSLVQGSKYSSEVVAGMGADGKTPVAKSVAKTWLTHPLARRVDEVLFRPGDGPIVTGDNGRIAMNLWEPIEITKGDVAPFLALTDHLFKRLPPSSRDLPLKLLAYKTQNQQEKIPLGLVILGPQGSGKTLWADLVREAFGPYGVSVTPKDLASEFQGWLETSIMATVNEISPKELYPVREKLKGLISDIRHSMNEKYRTVRQINSYTFYILTSNKRGVGAYDFDDRRMVVVDCPIPREAAFYDGVGNFKRNGGAKYVYAYLMNYDLQGWKPPNGAPMTPEKYMAFVENLTQVQRLAEDMKSAATGSMVRQWMDAAIAWAENMEVSQNAKLAGMARAVLNTVRQLQVRPWYTPEELTTMFPYIAVQYMGAEAGQPSPGKLSSELRETGINYLQNQDDPRGFLFRGRVSQFLVVAQFQRWEQPISQAEFDEYMRSWPTYGQLTTGQT